MEEHLAYGVPPYEPPDVLDKVQSRLPAVHLLIQLGWEYVPPDKANQLRAGRLDRTILEPVLAEHIRNHCYFTYKGTTHPFSENAIHSAIQALTGFRAISAARQAEKAYDLLCLGTSVPQTIEGDTKSFTVDYIDWKNPANNTYQCTTDFKVAQIGHQKYQCCDVVLFINGIPIVIMACMHPGNTRAEVTNIDRAIERLCKLQAKDGIPQLFHFSQLLLAVTRDRALYGTTGTLRQFWSKWKEPGIEAALRRVMNTPIDPAVMNLILTSPFENVRHAHPPTTLPAHEISKQDLTIYAICRPTRLLELAYKFILFDAGAKKIARYHQYATVRGILKRVLSVEEGQARPGGVVWHTQGSGKSLTMVMLAKSLALHSAIDNPRIILVTDRIDLDDQICSTFRACGLAPEQATTGKHLVELLNGRRIHVVTTLIHKFATATAYRNLKQVDCNTFVLVDEGHRSQYNEQHARMRITLKGACFIAFTGTPLAKSAQKNTFAWFGDLFRPPYTISRAVADKAVAPLLYEARHVPQRVNQLAVDGWFEKLTLGLTEEEKIASRRKFASQSQLNSALQTICMIAWDVSMHYATTYQHTGLKGQLVTPDKETALKYKASLDDIGQVTSEVIISAPSAREGDGGHRDPSAAEINFWRTVINRFGSEKNYNTQVINAFKNSDYPEIIIVVDKLLTGFNAPRNAVFYLARHLKEHTLLQAIARVNRLQPNKAFGLILDYCGVIQELDQAIDFYERLAAYDPADLEATVRYVHEYIGRLPQIHGDLWEIFTAVKGAKDGDAFETHLRDDTLRHRFLKYFSQYARTLALALSSTTFLSDTPNRTIQRYKADLKFFQDLRAAVSIRFQEIVTHTVDASAIKKLIDTHVGADEVVQLRPPVNFLDAARRDKVLADDSKSAGAKADIIAYSTRHVIEQEMSKDPMFYMNLSKLLEAVIEAHHTGRLQAIEALEEITDIAVKATTHTDDNIPQELVGKEMARRYYGCVCETVPAYGPVDAKAGARIAMRIAERLEQYKIRDWRTNPDAINKMRGEIDDILFEVAEAEGIDLCLEDQDAIIDRCIAVAITNEV